VQLGTTDLCKDDVDREVKIEFFRSNPSGAHKIVGTCNQMTLGTLKSGGAQYPIFKTGQFNLVDLKVERKHSFLEYVFGGCDIDLSIAIDFTLSNGAPANRDSLHYFDPL
jgi:hypothetical protein